MMYYKYVIYRWDSPQGIHMLKVFLTALTRGSATAGPQAVEEVPHRKIMSVSSSFGVSPSS